MHYHAPHWLPGAHLQTLWPLLLKRSLPLPDYQRERLSTPDGDFVDLDWVGGNKPMATPLLILFHGLEGSSSSHYARALMHAVAAKGWRGVVMNFRGCSGEINHLPRAYHSGDSAEIAWLLGLLQQRYPHAPLFAVGISLGGNALLKHLGEQTSPVVITAAAAISVPYDLGAACDKISRGFAKIYTRHFLASLIPRTLAKAALHPHHPVLRQHERIRGARSLRQFDDVVTAPLHGFRDAHSYYTQSSCRQYLGQISTPTLLVHAANDPFLPRSSLPLAHELPDCVRLEMLAGGGHAGFVHGRLPGAIDWLPQHLIQFFAQQIPHKTVP